MMCWQQIGYMMIIYIAGLQNVPADVLEAAAIDGASKWQLLLKVKLQLIRICQIYPSTIPPIKLGIKKTVRKILVPFSSLVNS